VILHRYLAGKTLLASLAAFVGVLSIFLAVDLVDNAGLMSGPGWVLAVMELYANKAAVVARQISPAALLLGTAIAVSGLRQTREWTALRSVGLGPWRVAIPVVSAVALACTGLVIFHELVGVKAAERAEEIRATRFSKGTAYRRWLVTQQPKRWFRGADGRRVYYLRGTLPGGGFERVTVLLLDAEFGLEGRIDAGRMEPASGGAWRLADVEVRRFTAEGASEYERYPSREYRFDEPPGSFDLRPGRPSQMSIPVLTEQIALRQRLGQPVADFALERAGRVAYPFLAVSGALLGVALALRRNRKGHIASAVLEAVLLSLALWAAQGIGLGLGLSGRLPPVVAAWFPNAIFLVAGAIAVRRSA
jgi:lipopolysaccharide export system permease protein